MPSLTRVMILYCGQGMTTLVEVYDDGVVKDAADYLALIDCGGSSDAGQLAVNYVAKKILDKKDAVLNLLAVSHQDSDHLDLLDSLETKLSNTRATLKRAVCGGSNWSDTNIETVKSFLHLMEMDDEVEFDAPQRSDYTKAATRAELKYIDWYKETFIRVLISGLPITGSADFQKNGSSAMVIVENSSYSVVLPGDATHQTMESATEIIDAKKKLIPPVAGLEIPHHGALRTSVQKYYADRKPDSFDWSRITAFAEALSAARVAASAGLNNSFNHPLYEVITVFWAWLVKTDSHGFRAYIFDKAKNSKTSQGWTNFTETQAAECTVRSDTVNAGKLDYGDIAIKLSKPGVFTPEEMIEFIPRGQVIVGTGTDDMEPVEDLVVYAPAPPESPAPVT